MVIAAPSAPTRGPHAARRVRYEPALDGVRGLAVLAVIGYHGRVAVLRGGFIGVDVFFVLSGYLITTLLLAEHSESGRIDIGAFWSRRARRLFPALLLLLVGIAAYSAFVASSGERGSIRADALASLFYIQNWHLVWSGTSYFALYAPPSPLRHLWSLAIEEQFYVVWPLTLVLLLRVLKRRRWILVCTLSVAVLASSVLMARMYHAGLDPSRVYYGTDTRAHELLVGALLAVLLARRGEGGATRVERTWALAGFVGGVVLVWIAIHASDSSAWLYRGGFLVVAIATALLIGGVVGAEASLTHRLLTWAPLRATGRISYGLYLWHWPVMLWLDPDRTGRHGSELLALRVAATFAIATLSYAIVERPVRSGVSPIWRGRRLAVAAVIAVAAVMLAVSVSIPRSSPALVYPALPSGATRRPPLPGPTTPATTPAQRNHVAGLLQMSPAAWAAGDLRLQADGHRLADSEIFLLGLDRDDGRPHIVMVGDSVLLTLTYPDFDPGPTSRADYYSYPDIGCGFLPGVTIDQGRSVFPFAGCAPELRETRWRMLVDRRRPDVSFLLVGTLEVFNNAFNGRIFRVGTAAYADRLREQLTHDVDLFSSRGGLVALPTVPCFDPPDYGVAGVVQDQTSRRDPRRVAAVNAVIRAVARARPKAVRIVDLAAFLCPHGHARDHIGGVTMRSDGIHFTPGGASIVARWLAPRLEAMVPPGPVFATKAGGKSTVAP